MIELDDKKKEWKEQVEELFHDREPILKAELEHTTKLSKNRKAPDPANLPAEWF